MGYIPQIDNNADKEDNDRVIKSRQRDDFDANTVTLTTTQEIGETILVALHIIARYTELT